MRIPNLYHKNCISDSKENSNKILGVKGLKQLLFFSFSFSFFDLELGVDPERFVPPRECE